MRENAAIECVEEVSTAISTLYRQIDKWLIKNEAD